VRSLFLNLSNDPLIDVHQIKEVNIRSLGEPPGPDGIRGRSTLS
jgi:hypothetical protein